MSRCRCAECDPYGEPPEDFMTTDKEKAPTNNLPDYIDCAIRVGNEKYLKEIGAMNANGKITDDYYYGSLLPNEIHRFIHEYDDSDPYRSAWFLHRLELLINETKKEAIESQRAEIDKLQHSVRFGEEIIVEQERAIASKDAEIESYRLANLALNTMDGEHIVKIEQLQSRVREHGILDGKYGVFLSSFLKLMDKELHANSGKGDRKGWLSMPPEIGMLEIYYHTGKLQKAVKDLDLEKIKEYSADVANMAMMMADICGVLPIQDCDNCFEGKSDMDHICKKCNGYSLINKPEPV